MGPPGPEIEREEAPVPISPNHEEKEEELKRIIGRLPKTELKDLIGKEWISRPVEHFSEEHQAACNAAAQLKAIGIKRTK